MQSLIIAFAMYSKIPMPKADWNEKNMRYTFCWFPLIGLVIGLLELAAYRVMTDFLQTGVFLRAVVLTVIPLLITGGIHLDGFMDTTDARSSYGDKEKKLEILKDSHVGAFAVMGCGVYLLLTAGAYSEMDWQSLSVMAGGFVLERALSGLAAVNFKGARSNGMLASFREPAKKQTVTIVLIAAAIISAGAMIWLWMPGGMAAVIGAVVTFVYYYQMTMKEFGGTTGDLAGWFLESCELVMLLTLVMVRMILGG